MELLQDHACGVVGNEPAIKSSIGAKMAPIEGPPDPGGTKINLSMLIDFLLQKTYHDLTVLSELWVFTMFEIALYAHSRIEKQPSVLYCTRSGRNL